MLMLESDLSESILFAYKFDIKRSGLFVNKTISQSPRTAEIAGKLLVGGTVQGTVDGLSKEEILPAATWAHKTLPIS